MQLDDDTMRAIMAKPLAEVTAAELVCLVLTLDDSDEGEDRAAAIAAELVPGATSSAT